MSKPSTSTAHDFSDFVIAQSLRKCANCGRVFDLFLHDDEQEWHYGHDCEEM